MTDVYEGYPPDVDDDLDDDEGCRHARVKTFSSRDIRAGKIDAAKICLDCGLCVCEKCIKKRGY